MMTMSRIIMFGATAVVCALLAGIGVWYLIPNDAAAFAAGWTQAIGSIAGIVSGAIAIRWQVVQEAEPERKRSLTRARITAADLSLRLDSIGAALNNIYPNVDELRKSEDSRKEFSIYFDSLVVAFKELPPKPPSHEIADVAPLDVALAESIAIVCADLERLKVAVYDYSEEGTQAVSFRDLWEGTMYFQLTEWKGTMCEIILALRSVGYACHIAARGLSPETGRSVLPMPGEIPDYKIRASDT